MDKQSLKISLKIASTIYKSNPFKSNTDIFSYLRKFKVNVVFKEFERSIFNWNVSNIEDGYLIEMNYKESQRGAYNVNYDILEAFISLIYEKENRDFKEVSKYVICYLLTKETLEEELIKVYKNGSYDLQHFSDIYKIPQNKILWYLRIVGYIV